jgi:hypothetical protein
MKQDPFTRCFNILQKRKEKVAVKGLTLNANMDKFVEGKFILARRTLYGCRQLENCLWINNIILCQ